jgi:hypothetical protein
MISTTTTAIAYMMSTSITSSNMGSNRNRNSNRNNTAAPRLIDERSLSLVERPSGDSERHPPPARLAATIEGPDRSARASAAS